MELLLNLTWLLLALPAYWLWHACRIAPARRRFTTLQCLLALGCLLVLLFPVVSATDDLRAMRAEMEESPASKRSIGQSTGDRPSASPNFHSQTALAASANVHFSHDTAWHHATVSFICLPEARSISSTGRAPPTLLLA